MKYKLDRVVGTTHEMTAVFRSGDKTVTVRARGPVQPDEEQDWYTVQVHQEERSVVLLEVIAPGMATAVQAGLAAFTAAGEQDYAAFQDAFNQPLGSDRAADQGNVHGTV